MLGTVEELVYVSEMNKTRTLPSDKLPTFFLKPKLMLCAVNFHILRAITNKNKTNIFLLYYGYSYVAAILILFSCSGGIPLFWWCSG
jgi:hypothetical protein